MTAVTPPFGGAPGLEKGSRWSLAGVAPCTSGTACSSARSMVTRTSAHSEVKPPSPSRVQLVDQEVRGERHSAQQLDEVGLGGDGGHQDGLPSTAASTGAPAPSATDVASRPLPMRSLKSWAV